MLDLDDHGVVKSAMEMHKQVGHAGLIGWREKVADAVAPRAPLNDDTARALIGGAFFVLSVYYVIQTIMRVVKD
jgi:hypothetical protein